MWPFTKKDERKIFRYSNGSRTVGIDPLVALRGLTAHPKFIMDRHLRDLEHDDQQIQDEAVIVCLGASRDVFGLDAWAEKHGHEVGVTDIEALKVLYDFVEYIGTLKKNGDSPATPQPPTEQPSLGAS